MCSRGSEPETRLFQQILIFWNKTPDELMIVAEDMRNSYCTDLGEYVEKRMRGNTLSQIKEVREIKEAIPEVQERKNKTTRTRKEIDWWD